MLSYGKMYKGILSFDPPLLHGLRLRQRLAIRGLGTQLQLRAAPPCLSVYTRESYTGLDSLSHTSAANRRVLTLIRLFSKGLRKSEPSNLRRA